MEELKKFFEYLKLTYDLGDIEVTIEENNDRTILLAKIGITFCKKGVIL